MPAAWASAPDPHACAGAQDAVKVMAKSLVRNRHAVTKMYGLKSQLQAVSLRIAVRPPAPPCAALARACPARQPASQPGRLTGRAAAQTLKSTQAMADAMRGATKAMGAMNKQMNLPALTKIMRDFERQNEKMEMTSEMMGDAVDDAFEVLRASCLPDPEQLLLRVRMACSCPSRCLETRCIKPCPRQGRHSSGCLSCDGRCSQASQCRHACTSGSRDSRCPRDAACTPRHRRVHAQSVRRMGF